MTLSAETEVRGVALIDDPFLSARLNRRVCRLPAGPAAIAAAPGLVARLEPPVMVEARVAAHRLEQVRRLERLGFVVADTTLRFERPRLPQPADPPGPGACSGPFVRPAGPGDEAAVTALARSSLRLSRFHRDPAIGGELADELEACWAANYFRGRRGDAMVVVEGPDAGLEGFLLALEAADGAMVVDLVAVDAAARGRGHAGRLARAAQSYFPRATRLRAGTQLVNAPAQRACLKLGFRPAGAECVLHLHVALDAPAQARDAGLRTPRAAARLRSSAEAG